MRVKQLIKPAHHPKSAMMFPLIGGRGWGEADARASKKGVLYATCRSLYVGGKGQQGNAAFATVAGFSGHKHRTAGMLWLHASMQKVCDRRS